MAMPSRRPALEPAPRERDSCPDKPGSLRAPMKILHLTCNDARNGGAGALHRLHTALLESGVDSRVLLGADEDKSESERHVPRPLLWRAADKPVRMIAGKMGLGGVARPSFRLWRRSIRVFDPDVLHLHWTYCAHSIPLTALRSLAAEYPIVWTFHDMWAITGGCTNSMRCERWLVGCGSCPMLKAGAEREAILASAHDFTALQWRIKRAILGGIDLTVVAPSQWMGELVRRSPLAGHAALAVVPNPLDTSVYAPHDKGDARVAAGLPRSGSVLLFVGKPENVYAYEGRVPLLLESLRQLSSRAPEVAARVHLLVIGGHGDRLIASSGYPGVAVGAVRDDARMAELVSAADILVDTTQYDTLPAVVQEAMSCGTAVIASGVGGLPDMIESGKTGILADPSSPTAFAAAMEMVLSDFALRSRMQTAARDFAVRRWDYGPVADTLIAVYAAACAGTRDRGP